MSRSAPSRPAVLSLLAVALSPAAAEGQIGRTVPPPQAESIEAPIAERYRASGLERWFLGGGYRDVWAVPVRIPVLDVGGTAGGLTPTETGGFGQTVSLEFVGDDGLEYGVRSIDKDPTQRLDSLLLGTVVARVVQDQVGQFLPTAGLVVDPLLDATGIPHPEHRLVVLPDDPQLGRFREEFAGLIGMLTDRPQEGPDDTRGFEGSRRIVGTDRFFDELEEGGCHVVDARGYMKARLMDLVIGDRDRHEGQWRWAAFARGDECWVWTAIPEDRDQAFVRNDGVMMTLYRLVHPYQVPYGPEYPSLVGLTFNGWEVDRGVLAELDATVWREVSQEIVRELDDTVIADAVRRLPDAHYELVGAFLTSSLRARRDALPEVATRFYRLLSEEAEVYATDEDELAELEHLPDGSLVVTVAYRDGSTRYAPHFERTFRPDETSEVRLFLRGGDDMAVVRGAEGRILARVIGGGGDDRIENLSRAGGGRTRFYDDRGDNEVDGAVRFDARPYERPPSSNLAHRWALDWGGLTRYLPHVRYDGDLGLALGIRVERQRYGFRKHPAASYNAFTALATSAGGELLVGWEGRFREAVGRADLVGEARYSGLDVLRFYGLGAGTVEVGDPGFYEVTHSDVLLAAGLEWSWGLENRSDLDREVEARAFRPRLRLGLGPVLKRSSAPARRNADRFIGTLDPAPLGFGSFGQVGGRGWLEIDTRDRPAYPTSGLRLRASAAAYPAAWDVREPFGTVAGSISTYLTPGRAPWAPTLAVRVGAESVFGSFPFHEAAFLGGRDNLRGTREERFAGDRAVFANAELRLPLATFHLLFPTELGVHGVADVGRVFLRDDPTGDDQWHTGFGGGVWLTLLNRAHALQISVVNGAELLGVYVGGGVEF